VIDILIREGYLKYQIDTDGNTLSKRFQRSNMLDYKTVAISQIEYWYNKPCDQENTLNSFDGTFCFSSHDKVPEVLKHLVIEKFPKKASFDSVPLEEVNSFLNSVWEGPGSMARLVLLIHQLRSMSRDESFLFPDVSSVQELEAALTAYKEEHDEI